MKKFLSIVVTSMTILGLGGCSSFVSHDNVSSTRTSAASRSVESTSVNQAQTKTATTTTATVSSGFLSGSTGKSMDEVDQLKMNQALESNRTNQSSSWSNPATHNNYSVTPTRTFTGPNGEPCRDFTTNAIVNGERNSIYGTACRDNAGKWRIVSS
jgi:surface antigen